MNSLDITEGSVPDWSELPHGQPVVFEHHTGHTIGGIVDMCSEDSSVLWVLMDNGAGRRLIHHQDGYRLASPGTSD
ncbi:hypothetical protein [Arthrobacter pigmenti]